jgi:hypothetical protein
MRIILGAALLACTILVTMESGWAQVVPTPAAPLRAKGKSGVEEELKTVELRLANLIVHGDWDEYEKHLTAGYMRVAADGKLENKDEVMSDFRKGSRKIIVMEPEDLHVRIYGETAVMQGHLTTSVRESGRVSTRNERFTAVFVRRVGQWLLAAEQETPMGK